LANLKRYKKESEGSINSLEFSDLKKCIEELQFMNNQYLLFKKRKKTLKTKTKNFKKFYETCLEKKDLMTVINTSQIQNDFSGDELMQIQKFKTVQQYGSILNQTPNEIDSLISEDTEIINKFAQSTIFEKVSAIYFI
jgi:tRNA nucleotidyltransferase/poly(A) polymerase